MGFPIPPVLTLFVFVYPSLAGGAGKRDPQNRSQLPQQSNSMRGEFGIRALVCLCASSCPCFLLLLVLSSKTLVFFLTDANCRQNIAFPKKTTSLPSPHPIASAAAKNGMWGGGLGGRQTAVFISQGDRLM